VTVEILDVSHCGARLELSTSLRPGSVYDIRADIAGYPLIAHARITRCSAGGYKDDGRGGHLLMFKAGVEFLWDAPERQEEFRKFLERSKASRPDSSPGILRPRF
jgi:hypothetical protein